MGVERLKRWGEVKGGWYCAGRGVCEVREAKKRKSEVGKGFGTSGMEVN